MEIKLEISYLLEKIYRLAAASTSLSLRASGIKKNRLAAALSLTVGLAVRPGRLKIMIEQPRQRFKFSHGYAGAAAAGPP